MYCVKCGKEIPDGDDFCIYCGAPAVHLEDYEEEDESTILDRLPGPKTAIALILLFALILAAIVLLVFHPFPASPEGDDAGDLDLPAAEEPAGKGDASEGSAEAVSALTQVSGGSAEIISSDWDWDSGEFSAAKDLYRVDAILYVRNDSDVPLTRIGFTVNDKKGNAIRNLDSPEEPLYAEGYVKAGEKGIMVAGVWTEVNELRPNVKTYQVQSVFTNEAIGDYEVPTGSVLRKYGTDNDNYDITLNNPNDVPVDDSAVIVAVKIRDDDIKDSDATGRISTQIPPKTEGYQQEMAFYDPNIYAASKDLTVYAIDTYYYKHAGKN